MITPRSAAVVFAAAAVAVFTTTFALPVVAAPPDADMQAIAAYALRMDRVDAWYKASKNLAIAAQRDPGLASRMERRDEQTGNDVKSIADMVTRFDAEPAVRKAISDGGLTTREYALVTLSLLQALMTDSMMQQSGASAVPEGVNPANIEFVRAHAGELQRRNRELRALTGDLVDDEEGAQP